MSTSIFRYAVGRADMIVILWFWMFLNIVTGSNFPMRETAAPYRNGMTATVEYPAAIARGAGPPITSLSVTSQQYLPNPSATISDSSMKWAVPLGNPVVPEVNRRTETSIPVSYTHLRAHETRHDLVCRLLLEKKK